MKIVSKSLVFMVLAVLMVSAPGDSQAGFGMGVEYWHTVGDITDNTEFEEGAFGFVFAYDIGVSLIQFEGIVEYVPHYAFGHDMIQPQVFATIGSFIYGGVGLGIGHLNGNWQNSPFYALRAGVKLTKVDFFTTFRFQSWDSEDKSVTGDADAFTMGAIFWF